MQNVPFDPSSVQLSTEALEHSQAVTEHLRQQVLLAGGWLSFAQWMHEALYAPALGYYSSGSAKLALRNSLYEPAAASGDFVTAPELSSAFGYTLAHQIAEVLRACENPAILEFGAGSGQLAADTLTALSKTGIDVPYYILEVSADFSERQRQRLQPFGSRVIWLDAIPQHFEGVIVANEVLDAMPVHLLVWGTDGTVLERGVIWQEDRFTWQDRQANAALTQALQDRMPPLPGYLTEVSLQAQAWVNSIAECLTKGAVILIDYGFSAQEYYHPQRHEGTLMCHIQHRSHANPLVLPGLQDITAHVDFSALAQAAHFAGLNVLGFTSQARFLLNAGIAEQINDLDPTSRRGLEMLLSEAQMGELFKVLALGRGIDHELMGFMRGDRRHQL
jgi:SAM-dependent MidA family methyltransferase